jgi:hypothetical protein
MIGLRVLARGSVLDDISELSGVGASTANDVFKKFVSGISRYLCEDYLSPPVGADLINVTAKYGSLGFPGNFIKIMFIIYTLYILNNYIYIYIEINDITFYIIKIMLIICTLYILNNTI